VLAARKLMDQRRRPRHIAGQSQIPNKGIVNVRQSSFVEPR
jgi:hypothetical protein